MKRILLVIPNLDFGGAQNSFWRLSLLLAEQATLELVVFNRYGLAEQPHAGVLRDLDVPASRSWVSKLYHFFQRVVRLRKIKQDFKPHISISFLEGADYVNLLSSVGEKILFYVHGSKIHDRNVNGFIGTLRKSFFIPFFYKKASAILVVNKRLEDEYKRYFGLHQVPFHHFPNFYDFERLRKLADEPLVKEMEALLSKHPVIGIMGRLAHEKGIDRFLRMIPELLNRQPNVRVLLVGDGPEKESLVRLASQLGIKTRDLLDVESKSDDATLFFAGYQPNPYKFLARCMVLALPSRNEGMPNSLVEAMGLGIPVTASNCPYGPAELLSPASNPPALWPQIAENGILLPDDETWQSAWVESLVRLISDEDLRERLREAGGRFARRYSSEDAREQWKKLLDESL